MNNIRIFRLSDADSEAISGGLKISATNSASADPIIIVTPNNPPQNIYDGGPLDYSAETFPGTSGVPYRNAKLKLT